MSKDDDAWAESWLANQRAHGLVDIKFMPPAPGDPEPTLSDFRATVEALERGDFQDITHTTI